MHRSYIKFHRQENSKSNGCLHKSSVSIVIREMLIRTINNEMTPNTQ